MNVAKGWLFAAQGGSRARQCVMTILFGNKLHWFESPCQHIIVSFLMCFILTNTQLNYAVTYLHLMIKGFKSYLCSIGSVRNASDADISVFFP